VHDAAQRLVIDKQLAQMPSYFEVLTALAFLHFAEQCTEIAVLEVGMGGRLDATNIVDPLLSIITDISLDHMEWLGSTIPAIAREKAGILRRQGVMITLAQHPEANQVLGEVASELGVRGVNAARYLPPVKTNADGSYCVQALGTAVEVSSPLSGAHQHRNLALAIAAAAELADQHGFRVTPEAMAEGIRKTVWPARLERIERAGVKWILDVAHNPAGAWALRAGLNCSHNDASRNFHPRILVFSCLRDKPISEMAQILFPLFDRVIIPPIHTSRAAALSDILAAAQATGTEAVSANSVGRALQYAAQLGQGGMTVVSGSVYLVGEARTLLMSGEVS
jgi:dihydrofolate synthase/folylpolyglutamate synthase